MPPTKVLLIEDDKAMLALLRTLLHLEGYQVVILTEDESIESAMEFIAQENPALVLMDVFLPFFNGFDLLYCLRQSEELNSVRVLMSSGLDFQVRCRNEGADGFILKPYMPEELMKAIQETLSSEPHRRE
jgi:DNA-binding response OmpR family regulator